MLGRHAFSIAFCGLAALGGLSFSSAAAHSAEPVFRTDGGDEKLPWFQLKPGEFPPSGSAHAISGELISVDHVRRAGVLRVDRNNLQRTDEYDKPLEFSLLPYGSVSYHGAPAELRDVPIGTHLHGQFYVNPAPAPNTQPTFNQALILEDDFSFAAARGRSWRIVAAASDKGTLTVVGIDSTGQADAKPTVFQIGSATRVWKQSSRAALADLAPGQLVLLNLTVCTLKGPGRVTDVWVDDESRSAAAAQQREIHKQYQREHGLAACISEVDNQAGILTLTILAGFDPSLAEGFKSGEYIGAAVADAALRTHDQVNDSKRGPVLSVEQIPPQPGSSGMRIRFKPEMLLEGFRPNQFVRMFAGSWPIDDLPREEKLYQ